MAIGSPDVNITIKATDKASGVLKRIGGGFAKLGLAVAAAGAGAAAGFAAIAFSSIKAAVSVESAFAGVAKTTDGLVDNMGQLTVVGEEIKQGFRDLAKEVPIAVEELMQIGELAGQLGVPKDALIDFTETVAALGETTNLTTEEAAVNLARLANIYQVESDNMAANTEQVGSALVGLGNNFAATEAEILQFAERIAGAGVIAGLTQADVLAIGAAMISVGIQAESGGTAVQTVLQEMQKAVVEGGETLDLFAEATGKSAEAFADAFRTDAAGAFTEFVLELGDQGEQAFLTLEELGLADRRLSRAFLSLGAAGDLLNQTMTLSSEEFEANAALMDEARIRYQTTEAQLRILKNTIRDIGLTIGDAFLPAINQVIQMARPFIDEFALRIEAAIDNFLIPAIKDLIEFFSVKLPAALEGLRAFLEPIKIGIGELADAFIDTVPLIEEEWDRLTQFFEDTIPPSLQDSFDNIGEGLIGLGIIWRDLDNFIVSFFGIMVETILTLAAGLLLGLSSIFKTITLVLTGEWGAAWDEILETFDQEMQLLFDLLGINWEEFKRLWTQILTDISTIFTCKLEEWSASLTDFINQTTLDVSLWALDMIGSFNEWASESAQAIDRFLTKLQELATEIIEFILPDWLLGNSPGDFELGLRGISAAMRELTNMRMPQLAGSLSGGGVLAGAPAGPTTSSSFVVQQLTVHAGGEQDGTRIAQQIMDEIGNRVRIATASGAGFIGG